MRKPALLSSLAAAGAVAAMSMFQGCGGGGHGGAFIGTATVAMPTGYAQPRGIAVETTGSNMFISAVDTSTQNAVILKLPKSGGKPTVVTTGSPIGTAGTLITYPVALALSPGADTLYIADFATATNGTAGAIFSVLTTGGSTTVLTAVGAIDAPTGLAVSSNGLTLFVSGSDPTTGLATIWSLPASGGAVTVLATGGALTQPTGLGLSSAKNTIFVADRGGRTGSAQLFSLATTGGTLARVTGLSNLTEVESGVASKNATLYIAARTGNSPRVSKVAESGSTETTIAAGSPLAAPNGVATDGQFYYVTDADASGNGLIVVLN